MPFLDGKLWITKLKYYNTCFHRSSHMLYLIKQMQNDIYSKCRDFYACIVRAFKCMHYTKITYATGCAKSDFFFVTSTNLLSCSLPQLARIVSACGLI